MPQLFFPWLQSSGKSVTYPVKWGPLRAWRSRAAQEVTEAGVVLSLPSLLNAACPRCLLGPSLSVPAARAALALKCVTGTGARLRRAG